MQGTFSIINAGTEVAGIVRHLSNFYLKAVYETRKDSVEYMWMITHLLRQQGFINFEYTIQTLRKKFGGAFREDYFLAAANTFFALLRRAQKSENWQN